MAVHTWTVEELCAGVSIALADAFPDQCWVKGQIRGLRRSPAGHLYFDLVDDAAAGRGQDPTISVVAFRGPLRGIEAVLRKVGDLRLEDGLDVRIRGRIEYYPPQGRVQFMMNAIDPRHTLGQLAGDRDAVIRALAAEGLLERNRQLPAPLVPLRIGPVTSAGSAAHHDFFGELQHSPFAFEVLLADTRVQGLDAHDMIAESIRAVDVAGVDVIAVVRGGGSRSDLIAFDQMAVARAIVEASVPVHVGVGHDIDLSVADQVAHASWKTPTACAAALVNDVARFTDMLDRAATTVAALARRQIDTTAATAAARADRVARSTTHALASVEHRLDLRRSRLAAASRRTIATADAAAVRRSTGVRTIARHRLQRSDDALQARRRELVATARRTLDDARRHVDGTARIARAMDPARTLELGYSITRTESGELVSTVDHARPGQRLVTVVRDGRIITTVEETEADAASPADPAPIASPTQDTP